MRYNRAYSPKEELVITLDETPATFEQIAHLFEMGVRTDAPAADGGGDGYIYEYVLPTTSVPTLKRTLSNTATMRRRMKAPMCLLRKSHCQARQAGR
jgi:hypothetical protein